ncbi:MAG: hypothetical protein DRP12_02840 [Candidatus Aenigmatarchaeota archaeon]|nr:MAG: hypothetical protein DRP12_02840 [Candidatus Aenigmarchaeota archaeon]
MDIKIVVILHTCLGLLMGWISLILSGLIGNLFTGLLALAVAIPLKYGLERAKVETKSWIGNGLIIYLFVWFVTWTYLYNVLR